jgi:hypothetical protein
MTQPKQNSLSDQLTAPTLERFNLNPPEQPLFNSVPQGEWLCHGQPTVHLQPTAPTEQPLPNAALHDEESLCHGQNNVHSQPDASVSTLPRYQNRATHAPYTKAIICFTC